jgi:hypothetical protein
MAAVAALYTPSSLNTHECMHILTFFLRLLGGSSTITTSLSSAAAAAAAAAGSMRGRSAAPGALVAIRLITINVLPRPMSSARMPPRRGAGRESVSKFVRLRNTEQVVGLVRVVVVMFIHSGQS